MLKNKIIAIFCSIMLVSPVFAEDIQNTASSAPSAVETVNFQNENIDEQQNISENTNEIAPTDIEKPTYKQPVSKRKIAKKFLLAMLGVVTSSVLIFVILSAYNKIRNSFINGEMLASKDSENSLESPEDLTDAIKSFLSKTKWE